MTTFAFLLYKNNMGIDTAPTTETVSQTVPEVTLNNPPPPKKNPFSIFGGLNRIIPRQRPSPLETSSPVPAVTSEPMSGSLPQPEGIQSPTIEELSRPYVPPSSQETVPSITPTEIPHGTMEGVSTPVTTGSEGFQPTVISATGEFPNSLSTSTSVLDHPEVADNALGTAIPTDEDVRTDNVSTTTGTVRPPIDLSGIKGLDDFPAAPPDSQADTSLSEEKPAEPSADISGTGSVTDDTEHTPTFQEKERLMDRITGQSSNSSLFSRLSQDRTPGTPPVSADTNIPVVPDSGIARKVTATSLAESTKINPDSPIVSAIENVANSPEVAGLSQPEKPLTQKYSEYRDEAKRINRKQITGEALTEKEKQDRNRFNLMIRYDMFNPNLTPEQLEARHKAVHGIFELEDQFALYPDIMALQYKALGKKSLDEGLTDGERIRFDWLTEKAGEGRFEKRIDTDNPHQQ